MVWSAKIPHFPESVDLPRTMEIDTLSLNRVGNACLKMGDVGWDESSSPTKDFPGVLLGLADSAQPTLKKALALLNRVGNASYVDTRATKISREAAYAVIRINSHSARSNSRGFELLDQRDGREQKELAAS